MIFFLRDRSWASLRVAVVVRRQTTHYFWKYPPNASRILLLATVANNILIIIMADSNKEQPVAPVDWHIKFRPYLAEFFATTMFVWVGCGTAVSTQSILMFDPEATTNNTFHVSVCLAFGLAISVLVYAIAPISGGHINPAVTFAFALIGQMTWLEAAHYIVFQCLGALLGAAILWGTYASDTLEGGDNVPPFLVGTNFVTPTVPLASAFLGEAMGTFILVWTVMMTAVSGKSIAGNLAPIAIGWAVTLAHFVLVPLTGCGINPARSLGPMLVIIFAGEKAGEPGWWIYYTAPFVGSLFAVGVTKYIFGIFDDESVKSDEEIKEEKEEEEVIEKIEAA